MNSKEVVVNGISNEINDSRFNNLLKLDMSEGIDATLNDSGPVSIDRNEVVTEKTEPCRRNGPSTQDYKHWYMVCLIRIRIIKKHLL